MPTEANAQRELYAEKQWQLSTTAMTQVLGKEKVTKALTDP